MKFSCLFFLSLILSLFSKELLYDFKGTEKVLDLMCGEGDFSLEIAKIVRKGAVVGVDLSMKSIDIAKSKHLQAPSHLTFKHKAVSEFSLKDEFDLITCSNQEPLSISFLEFVKKGISHLKNRGYVDLVIMDKLPSAIKIAFKALSTSEKWSDYFLSYDQKEKVFQEELFMSELSNSQCQLIEKRKIPEEKILASDEEFKKLISGWICYQKMIPEASQADFLHDFLNRYLMIFPKDREGKIHVLVEKLEILAQKMEPIK